MTLPKFPVAQICLSRSWGGMEMSTLRVAEYFREEQFTSSIICLSDSRIAKEAAARNFKTLELNSTGYVSLRDSFQIRSFVEREEIASIFCHQLKDLWRLYPAFIGYPRPKVFGFARMFLKKINKKDFLHREIYAQVTKLILLTREQEKSILRCLPVSPEKLVVIPNGVDLNKFNPQKRSERTRHELFHAVPTDLVIGVIGRLDPKKGQKEFIKAVGALKNGDVDFSRVKFVIVGEVNPGEEHYKVELKSIADNSGAPIIWINHLEDPSTALASLDLLVVPSYEEAFGNVTIEGLASGVPVVGTRTGGTPDLITDGFNGRLIAPENHEAIADAIKEFLTHKSTFLEFAKQGLYRAANEFDVSIVKKKLIALVADKNQ